ncbi:MAG: protein phosphatase 2C domain-containing protein [Lachnospiraceae bacterium]|nr:protein phosphatase 2C domain-containing protein [Lachnospiraceae bacterium]
MNFMIAAHSDVGIKKNTNQDSLLIKVAQTNLGRVCLCVVCDGMGGLAKGELASATVIKTFESWFESSFPAMLDRGFDPDELKLEWDNIVLEQNQKLSSYAARQGTRMGTTIVALLIIGNDYYIMNVGDSREYMLTDQLYLLTKDQTVVQYQLDMGMISWEEAQVHPQRNVLLQCVGASEVVTPDFYGGKVYPGTVFALCSDGFRHVLTPEEIFERFSPNVLADERAMKENAVYLIELNKQRRETDNISVALIKTCQGD